MESRVLRLGNNLVFLFPLSINREHVASLEGQEILWTLFNWIGIACLLAAGWLASVFQQNYFFIITNGTCWHLAINMKWSKLGLQVKVKEQHISNSTNYTCFICILCPLKAHLCGFFSDCFSLTVHVLLKVKGTDREKVSSLMVEQHNWPPPTLRQAGQTFVLQLNNRNKFTETRNLGVPYTIPALVAFHRAALSVSFDLRKPRIGSRVQDFTLKIQCYSIIVTLQQHRHVNVC